MRSDVKDTLTFIVVAMCNQIWTAWFTIFSYLGSYAKFRNPQISIADFYTALIFITSGTIFGNYATPNLLRMIPLRYVFLMAGVGAALVDLNFLLCLSWPLLFANGFAAGWFCQTFQLGAYTYFKIKYGERSSRYFGIISCGYPLGTIVLVTLIKNFINPESKIMNFMELGEPTFDKSVSDNVPRLMIGLATAMACMTTFLVSTIDDIEQIAAKKEEELVPDTGREDFLKSMSARQTGGNSLILNPSTKRITGNILTTSFVKMRAQSSNMKNAMMEPVQMVSFSSKHPSRTSRLQEELFPEVEPEPFNEHEEVRSFRFLFLFICNACRILSMEYAVDNYHYMAGLIIQDDDLIIRAYMFCAVVNIVGRFISGFVWEKLGMERCITIGFCAQLTVSLTYALWASHSKYGFAMMISFTRFFFSMSCQWCPMILFSIYPIENALVLAKYYDLYIWAAIFIDNVFNRLFVFNFSFGLIFFVFFVVEAAGFIFFMTFKERFYKLVEQPAPLVWPGGPAQEGSFVEPDLERSMVVSRSKALSVVTAL